MKKSILALSLLFVPLAGAKESLADLEKEFEAANVAVMEKYRNATTDEEKNAAHKSRPSPADFVERAIPLIKAKRKDATVLNDIGKVMRVGRMQGVEELFGIIETHRESEHLGGVLMYAEYEPSGKLKELREWARMESPHPKVQAIAAYFRGSHSDELDEAEKIAELKFAQAYEGKLEVMGHDLKEELEHILFEQENFGIGKVAPEIEGEDAEGESFKLSDYRGKVVVLDFWGDW